MFAFLRRLGGTVRYEQPIREPHRDDLEIIPGLFPPVPESVTRQLRAVDAETASQLRQLDILLGNWSGRPVKRWDLVDQYLDERLIYRPVDAMNGGPS
jgi:hypothetical protein